MIKERKFCELINCTGDIKLVYLITLLDIKEDEFYFPPEPYDSEIDVNIFDLYEQNQNLQRQLKEKDKIIDEAIEFIDNYKAYENIYKQVKPHQFVSGFEDILDEENINKLLEILERYKNGK